MERTLDKLKFTWSDFKNESAPISAAHVASIIDETYRYDTGRKVGQTMEVVQEYLLEKKGIQVGISTLQRIRKEAIAENIMDEDNSAVHVANGSNYNIDEVLTDIDEGKLSLSEVAREHGISKTKLFGIRKKHRSDSIQANPFEKYMSSQSSVLEDVIAQPLNSQSGSLGRGAAAAAGLAVGIGLLTLVPGCDGEDEDQAQAQFEILRESNVNLNTVKKDMKSAEGIFVEKTDEVVEAQKKIYADFESQKLENIQAQKYVDDTTKEVKEGISKANTRLDTLEDGIVKHDTNIQRHDKEIAQTRDDVTELRNEVALPTAGERYALMDNYRLIRTHNDKDGKSETLTLFDGNGTPLVIIDTTKYGEKDFDLVSRLFDEKDTSHIGTKGGLYVKDRAVQHTEEIEDIVRSLRKASKDKDEAAFKKAFIRMSSIGDNPSYPLLGTRAGEIVNLFESLNIVGSYKSDNEVDFNGDFIGRKNISVEKYESEIELQPKTLKTPTTPATPAVVENVIGYKIFSNPEIDKKTGKAVQGQKKELLMDFFMPKDLGKASQPEPQPGQTPDAGLVSVSVDNDVLDQEYKLDIPAQYVNAMVDGWARANQRNRDKIKADIALNLAVENAKGRAQDFIERNQSGVRLDSIYANENKHSETLRIAAGTNNCLGVELHNAEDQIETDTGVIDQKTQYVDAVGRFFLGEENPNSSSANDRPILEMHLTYQGDETDITRDLKSPVTETDATGQFTSVVSDNAAEEETNRDVFASIGGKTTWESGSDLTIAGYFDKDVNHVKGSTHIQITDNWGTGIFPGDVLEKDVSYDIETEVEKWGLEVFGQIDIGDHMIIPFLGYELGTINIDQNILDSIQGPSNLETEIDFDELRFGFGYRIPEIGKDSTNSRFLGGLFGSIGDNDTEHFSEWEVYASGVFSPNDYLVLSPRASFETSGNNWGVGLTLIAGGKGFADESVNALDDYQMSNFYDQISRQFTDEMDVSRRNFRFYNGLARGIDGTYALDFDIFKQVNEEGEDGIGFNLRNLLLVQHANSKTGIDLDIGFDNLLDQFKIIGGVGHYGKKWYSRVGVGGTSDSDDIIYQLSAGVNF